MVNASLYIKYPYLGQRLCREASNEEAVHRRPMFCRSLDVAVNMYFKSGFDSFLSLNDPAINTLLLSSIRIEITTREDTVLYGAVKISRGLQQKGDSPQRKDSL